MKGLYERREGTGEEGEEMICKISRISTDLKQGSDVSKVWSIQITINKTEAIQTLKTKRFDEDWVFYILKRNSDSSS